MFKKRKHVLVAVLLSMVLSACGQNSGLSDGATSQGSSSSMPMASGMEQHATSGASEGTGGAHHGSAQSNAPYDAQFIDSMIEHHTGAIAMAEDALKQSERPEIKQLAEAIIRDQRREVEQMQVWRQQWYPDLAPTSGMGMHMGDMAVAADSNQPYDQRFITAMIAHHNGAIAMAQDARTKAEHAEIKQLADAIIKAQEAEVAQLQQWQEDWFGAS